MLLGSYYFCKRIERIKRILEVCLPEALSAQSALSAYRFFKGFSV
jgi:hypothetical protein